MALRARFPEALIQIDTSGIPAQKFSSVEPDVQYDPMCGLCFEIEARCPVSRGEFIPPNYSCFVGCMANEFARKTNFITRH